MSNTKSNLLGLLNDLDSIFSILDESDKEIIRKHHYCSAFKKGEIIFKEGDLPAGLVCLSEGKVKVIKEGVG